MAIGPGFVPAQLPTGQEYFKLPFNELLAGLSAKQKQFDTAEDEKNKLLEGLLKVNPYFQPHKDYLNKYTSDLYSNIDNLTNQYQGDISKALPEIKRMARKVNQDLTYGDLATINASTKGAQEYLKQKQDLSDKGEYEAMFDMGLSSGRGFNELSQLPFEQAIQDGKLRGFNYTGIHSKAKEQDEANKIFNVIETDAKENKWFNPKTGKWTSTRLEEIGRGKIYDAATSNYKALSPNFRAELDYRFNNAPQEELIRGASNYYMNVFGSAKDKSGVPAWQKQLELDLKSKDINHFKEVAKVNYLGELGEKYLTKKTKDETMPLMEWIKFQKENEVSTPIQQPINPTLNPNQVIDFTGGRMKVDKDGKLRVEGKKEKTEELMAQVDMTTAGRTITAIKDQLGDGWLGGIMSILPQIAVSLPKALLKTAGFFFEDDKEIESTNPTYQNVSTNLRNRGIIPSDVKEGDKKEKEIVSEFINSRLNSSVNAIGNFSTDPKHIRKFNEVFGGDAKGDGFVPNRIIQTFKFLDETNKVYTGKVFGEKFRGKPFSYGATLDDINSPYEYGSTVIFVDDEDDKKAPLKQFIMQPDLTTRQSQEYFVNGLLRARHGLDKSEFELPSGNQVGLPPGKYTSEIKVQPGGVEIFEITTPSKQIIKYKQEGQELVKIQ
jgi:hypothetical protein